MGSLLDRSKIVMPGPGGESLVIFQPTFLSEHWYLPCIPMNNRVLVYHVFLLFEKRILTVAM